MASRNKRVMKEIQDCQREANLTQIDIETVGEDLTHLRGTFPGPASSPYEGGTFEVAIEVPVRYPFEPLKMKFITRVYHPNISSQSGAICLDILKDAWSPVLTLKTTLVSLQSLLCSPEPHDPQDAEVAKVYLSDRKLFESTARNWTQTYAKGKGHLESTSRSVTTMQEGEGSGVGVIESSIGTHYNSSGGSTATIGSANSNEIQMRPEFERDVEDRIRNFALDKNLIRQLQPMGFDIDSIISAMIHVQLTSDEDETRGAVSFSAVLENLLN